MAKQKKARQKKARPAAPRAFANVAEMEEAERVSYQRFLEESPGAARYMIGVLRKELALAAKVIAHPDLGPTVAASYQSAAGRATTQLEGCRTQAMLMWAAERLELEWRWELMSEDEWINEIRMAHVGPATFHFVGRGHLQAIDQADPFGYKTDPRDLVMAPIERVVKVALWPEIPREFWPKDLELPELDADDADAASSSKCAPLRKWLALHGAQYARQAGE